MLHNNPKCCVVPLFTTAVVKKDLLQLSYFSFKPYNSLTSGLGYLLIMYWLQYQNDPERA